MNSVLDEQWADELLRRLIDVGVTSPASNVPPEAEATRAAVAMAANTSLSVTASPLVSANTATSSLAAAPLVSARASEFVVASAVLRPAWNVAALPYIAIQPAPAVRDPVRVGDFLLWPDIEQAAVAEAVSGLAARVVEPPDIDPIPRKVRIRPLPLFRAVFASAVPQFIDVSLTVQAAVQPDRSIRITGGTVVLTVSVYSAEKLAALERFRQKWTAALSEAGYGDRVWRFEPLSFRNLSATLDLPSIHLVRPAEVSANTNAGTVTYVADLTETGVLVWKSALETRNPGAIAGICRVNVSYFSAVGDHTGVKDQPLSSPLGTLLGGCGPERIHSIDPQQTVEARLVIVGSNLVQTTSVSLAPTLGQAPVQQVFGPDGGQVSLSVTTQDVNSVEVDWQANVVFKSVQWPVVPISGKLVKANIWSDMKNLGGPEFIANFVITTLLVGADGKTPVKASEAGTNYHVNGVLTFTAAYLPRPGILTASFDSAHEALVNVALPQFPGQPSASIILNMFATRDGFAGTASRLLGPTELVVVVLVKPDGTITIRTSSDPLPELSAEAEVMGLLSVLR